MKNMQLFMDKIQLSMEGQQELNRQVTLLCSKNRGAELDAIAAHFFADKSKAHYNASLEQVRNLAKDTGMPDYTAEFLYMMTCAELLLEEYRRDGLSEELFWETMYDLHCKFEECYAVYRIWGTFVSFWYYEFWTHKIFKLGRLEYEISTVQTTEYRRGSFHLKKGDLVYSVHIPSEGPLRPEAVLASLQRAHQFFGYQKGALLPCVCYSWLLWPDNTHLFPQNSNLKKFFDLFDIVESEKDEAFSDCWRVFFRDLNGDPASLNPSTTLQKNIVDWLTAGNSMGEGTGFLLFDGTGVLLPQIKDA